ncbi:hypothetical protein PHAVU_009G017100 [Phaseolus vulgaris]|uniref:Uncharacterized protein n=1 Tax=Phaseolus vulgaris TaxID=3885 RepID=V7AV28_PHAVU|nr:hypothetical protein PHAVU_009G017100g [Phaseolus vulgaris]ESW08086.1 hypothetical protein PHAVU_009G017100g [Phaseolus vulgaris]
MALEDSKPVKKEEESNKSSVNKKVAKVKKEEVESVKKEPKAVTVKKEPKAVTVKKELKVKKEIDDDILLVRRTPNSKEVIKKKKIKEKVKEVEKKKREKKVYDLPGQKRDPPEEKDPLRIFYESLYTQIPHSEMSQIWLMESGLLPKEVARKVFEKKQKKCPTKLSSPVKAVSAVKSSTKSVTVKKKNPTSPLSSLKKNTTNSTSKHSIKRKSMALSSEDENDPDSDDEVIIRVVKRRKMA